MFRVFSVSKEVLRSGPVPVNQVLPVKLVGKKSSQGLGLTVSPSDGSLIFSPFTELAVAEWNPSTNQQRFLLNSYEHSINKNWIIDFFFPQFRVISFDEESLQFVADMTFSRYDPGALYILSSKFQRFFLKNLNSNEINTRILRIQHVPSSYLSFPPLKTIYSHFPSITHKPQIIYSQYPQTTKPIKFNNQYFNSIRQPYQYEPVGVINRGINNPFTAFNSGEQIPRKPSVSIYHDGFLAKLNTEYVTYNNLRVAKSIKPNITTSFI